YALHYGPLSTERSLPRVSYAMWWFLIYALIFVLHIFFISQEFVADFVSRCFTLVQLGLIFWVTSGLFRGERLARDVLLSFSIASSVFAVANIVRVPGFYQELDGRVTGLGTSPNAVGTNMAVALITIIGLVLYGTYRHSITKPMLVILMGPLLAVMVASSSRGGLAAFMVGCIAYLFPYRRSRWLMSAILGM